MLLMHTLRPSLRSKSVLPAQFRYPPPRAPTSSVSRTDISKTPPLMGCLLLSCLHTMITHGTECSYPFSVPLFRVSNWQQSCHLLSPVLQTLTLLCICSTTPAVRSQHILFCLHDVSLAIFILATHRISLATSSFAVQPPDT